LANNSAGALDSPARRRWANACWTLTIRAADARPCERALGLERYGHSASGVADAKGGKALESLLKKLVQAGYHLDEHDAYKCITSGCAADHLRAELLRRKV
jgi:hypothetical protein